MLFKKSEVGSVKNQVCPTLPDWLESLTWTLACQENSNMIQQPSDRASTTCGNRTRYFPDYELASPAESLESWLCLQVYIEMFCCQPSVRGARVLIDCLLGAPPEIVASGGNQLTAIPSESDAESLPYRT